jgi:hypothetical protein
VDRERREAIEDPISESTDAIDAESSKGDDPLPLGDAESVQPDASENEATSANTT